MDLRWATADHTPDLLDEWITEQDRMDRMLAPYGERLLAAARIGAGERVIDIGCGTGALTARAAGRGTVLGIDVSARMLDAAARRTAHVPGVSLVLGDAQTHPFDAGAYDVGISRFGMGHFGDRVAALRNLGAALRPGGRLTFVEWGDPAANEWMTLPDRVGTATLGGRWPVHPNPTGGDEARLREALGHAGFVEVSIDTVAEPMWAGHTVPDVLAWFQTLPDSRPLRALPGSDRRAYLAALRAELTARHSAAGVLLGGSALLVSARRPPESGAS